MTVRKTNKPTIKSGTSRSWIGLPETKIVPSPKENQITTARMVKSPRAIQNF